MPVFPLLAAPLLISLSLAVQRRLGPAAGGWAGAIPASIAVAILGVGTELGPTAAARLAAAAAAHVGAQVAFVLVFAATLDRHGRGDAGLAAACLAFAAASLLVALVPTSVAIAVAPIALAVTLRPAAGRRSPGRLRQGDSRAPIAPSLAGGAIAAAVAAGLVAAVLTVARLSGPLVAGTLGAFPAVSTVLALVTIGQAGSEAGADALRGLLCGLVGYFAFCTTTAVAVPVSGVAGGAGAGAGACALATALLLAAQRAGRRGAKSGPPVSGWVRTATSAPNA